MSYLNKRVSGALSGWLPVAAWCFLIFFVSGIPNLRIEAIGIFDLIFRKIAHFTEYAVLAGLTARALRNSGVRDRKSMVFWACFAGILYAVSDEYHQYLVPGRYFAIKDILLDSAGCMAGALIYGKKSGK